MLLSSLSSVNLGQSPSFTYITIFNYSLAEQYLALSHFTQYVPNIVDINDDELRWGQLGAPRILMFPYNKQYSMFL